jgi:hypothetical protein
VGWPRGLWGAQSGSGVDGREGTFATPILDILGRHPERTPTTVRCGAASTAEMVVGRHLCHSHLGGVSAWTPAIEGEDAGEQGLRTRAITVGRRGRSRHEDTHSSEMTEDMKTRARVK